MMTELKTCLCIIFFGYLFGLGMSWGKWNAADLVKIILDIRDRLRRRKEDPR